MTKEEEEELALVKREEEIRKKKEEWWDRHPFIRKVQNLIDLLKIPLD